MKNSQNQIPVLPIRNLIVFPGAVVPIRVGRSKSIAAIKKAMAEEKAILVLVQKTDKEGEVNESDLYRVGTLSKIEKLTGSDSEGYQIIVRGMSRFRVTNLWEKAGAILAEGEEWKDLLEPDSKVNTALAKSLKTLSHEILDLIPGDTRPLSEMIDATNDIVTLSHLCASNLEMSVAKRQEILEMVSVKSRVLLLLDIMQSYRESLQVQSEIRDKLAHKLGRNQREAILREHLKAINEELGEAGPGPGGKDDYRKRIEDAQMPEEVKKVALEELKRLEAVGNQSPESHVIRNYLDLLVAMPWAKSSPEDIDINVAREILNHDHYGVEKVKKRILQHLAVMKLKKKGHGSILLFVGPPGVGKTSLGQSIARALGRKFVRGSLGGVRDDSEIRGHRRTYIGAMPGRIIQGIKRAGVNNPVFMLDEVDKLVRGYQGDPASALLEVLDPEQNATFLDHYLDVTFDLSHVMFIGTANTIDSIPGPLLDRMEVIELTGYTTAEKLHIAKNHLIPKQLEEYGLTSKEIFISDEVLMRVITQYTREAGVRDLQRNIAAICRATTEKVVAKDAVLPIKVEPSDLDEMLGPEKYTHEVAEKMSQPGVATGLAWTPQGGEILFIESSLMPGEGRLILTGQLGDVMKESAQIALSVVRSRLPYIAADLEYAKKDLHIHVPAGAIPKDGPSAGIAILTAVASLFSGRLVNSKMAMTGEITLRGAVMPVGGIKEKVIAAHRAGIKRVIMAKRNQRDLRDVPEQVKSSLKFDFVENASEVLKLALDLDVKVTQPGISTPSSPPHAVA